MAEFRRVMLEGSLALSLALAIELVAGGILEARVERLTALPYLLFMVPALNNMVGTLGTIIVARLSTALHLGEIEPRLSGNPGIGDNFKGVVAVGVLTLAYLLSFSLGIMGAIGIAPPDPIPRIVASSLAGVSSLFFVVLTGVVLSVGSFRRGMDPSVSVLPLITAIGDVYGVSSLILASMALGVI